MGALFELLKRPLCVRPAGNDSHASAWIDEVVTRKTVSVKRLWKVITRRVMGQQLDGNLQSILVPRTQYEPAFTLV